MMKPDMLTPGTLFFDGSFPFYLNRVGESFELQYHRHDFYEINYVEEGAGFHFVGEETLPVAKGDLFLLPVGVSHVFRPPSANADRRLVVYNCLFKPDQARELILPLLELDGVKHASGLLDLAGPPSGSGWRRVRDTDGRFGRLLRAMYHEFSQQQTGYRARICGLFVDFVVQLERAEDGFGGGAGKMARHPIEAALAHIEEFLAEPLHARTLAGLVQVSERHFHRLFKAGTGQTVTHYIQNRRIERACGLLRTTGRAVTDIAAEVGYQDKKFFLQLFKARTGVTPGRYRRGGGGGE